MDIFGWARRKLRRAPKPPDPLACVLDKLASIDVRLEAMSNSLARVVIRSLKVEDGMAHIIREVGEIGRDLAAEAESLHDAIRMRQTLKCRLSVVSPDQLERLVDERITAATTPTSDR